PAARAARCGPSPFRRKSSGGSQSSPKWPSHTATTSMRSPPTSMTFGMPLATEKDTGRSPRRPPPGETTMDMIGSIRGLTPRTSPTPAGPWESRYTLFLKLVSRHRAGGLVIGHYVTNPDERPDHVFQHDCRFRTFTQGDFVTTRWAVSAITAEE